MSILLEVKDSFKTWNISTKLLKHHIFRGIYHSTAQHGPKVSQVSQIFFRSRNRSSFVVRATLLFPLRFPQESLKTLKLPAKSAKTKPSKLNYPKKKQTKKSPSQLFLLPLTLFFSTQKNSEKTYRRLPTVQRSDQVHGAIFRHLRGFWIVAAWGLCCNESGVFENLSWGFWDLFQDLGLNERKQGMFDGSLWVHANKLGIVFWEPA